MDHALQVLEFDLIRRQLARHSETELGEAACLEIKPEFDHDAVWQKLNETLEAVQLVTNSSPPSLAAVRNLGPAAKAAAKGKALSGVEISACGHAMRAIRQLKQFIEGQTGSLPFITGLLPCLTSFSRQEEAIFASVSGDGEVLDSASTELAEVRAQLTTLRHRIVERIQGHATGRFREYLSDPIYTSRFGRYVLPVKSEYKGKVKGVVHDSSASGSTLYIEPEDILEMGNRSRSLEGKEREEVERILAQLSAMVGDVAEAFSTGIGTASIIDGWLARARISLDLQGQMPVPGPPGSISLEGARHPLLDSSKVIPLNIEVGTTASLVITGPNTGGKTVAIKNVGLAVAMAQSGIFPKARHCKLGPFSAIFADIGDEQSLEQSLSTFSGHIRNLGAALKAAQPKSLVLVDELGAGTDPAEGAALAKAILLFFQAQGCAILASSHFGELKAFAFETAGFANASMEFDIKSLSPTYHLIMGAAGASHAFKIAQKYGLPVDLIDQAQRELGQGQVQISRLMEELDTAQKRARISQSQADKESAQLQNRLQEAESVRHSLEQLQASLRTKTMRDLEVTLREVRLESERFFDQMRARMTSQELHEAKEGVKAIENKARRRVARFKLGALPDRVPEPNEKEVQVGSSVRVRRFNQVGTLLERQGSSCVVQVGALKMKLDYREIEPASSPVTRPKANLQQSEMKLNKAATVSPEVTLRMMRVDQAEAVLNKYLDDAILAGLDRVKIVHGKGDGILRSVTEKILKSHPQIAEFHRGDPSEGGDGVTIASIQ